MLKNIYHRVFKRRLMSHGLSQQEAEELIGNRTKFKLYTAEQHLKNLKNLEQDCTTMHSSKGRVEWEMEIESFLFHLVGVSDSLVAKTNDIFGFNLGAGKVRIEIMEPLLINRNEGGLLSNLRRFDNESWFHKLRDWRNQVTHISLLPMLFTIDVGEGNKPRVFFRDDQDKKLEVIPFLEDSLQNVKVLLQDIIKNEPRLG
jgi:hypothetical protein